MVKLWTAGFTYLLVISILNSVAFGMTNPLVPGFTVSLGASLTAAGFIAGMFSYVALIGRPISSILGDRGNKKRLLILSLVANGLFTVLYAAAPDIMWLVPIRILHGLFFSLSGTIFMALGAEYIPKERLGEGVGFLGMGQIIGMALGPNVGILLLYRYSYELCFIISGAGIMLAGFLIIPLRYTQPPRQDDGKKSFSLKDLVAVELMPNAIFAAIFAVGNGLVVSYLILLGEERGILNIALYFMVNSIVILVTRPVMGRLVDRKGVAVAILPGYILTALAMVAIGLATSIWPILLAAVLVAVGSGGGIPAIQTDNIRRLDSAHRTVAIGTFLIGMDIGMGAGPIFGGMISDAFGFEAAFLGTAGLMIVGFVCYLAYSRRGSKCTSA